MKTHHYEFHPETYPFKLFNFDVRSDHQYTQYLYNLMSMQQEARYDAGMSEWAGTKADEACFSEIADALQKAINAINRTLELYRLEENERYEAYALGGATY